MKLGKFRIPYMGSKQKHASKLMDRMLEIKPNATHFVDLFGGGGSMSFAALEHGLIVHYNEIDKGMCNLIGFLKNHSWSGGSIGVLPDNWYKFVSRGEFKAALGKDDACSQMIKVCYSFGNNATNYLFSEINEKIKSIMHDVVVYKCEVALNNLNTLLGLSIQMPNDGTLHERRLNLCKQVIKFKRLDLEQLEQLERLQQLEGLEGLDVTNYSFDEVPIDGDPETTIIYLDPPYRGKAKYTNDVQSEYIDDYMKQMGVEGYTCFLSEYEAPFEAVLNIQTRSTLSPTNNSTKAVEKLYINRTL